MKTLMMIALLACASAVQAEQPTKPMPEEQGTNLQAGGAVQEQPHVRKRRAIGSSASLPCEEGHKLVGDDCVMFAQFDD